MRLADTGSLVEKDGWYDVGSEHRIKVSGARPRVRTIAGKKELLVQVFVHAKFDITYRWNKELLEPVK